MVFGADEMSMHKDFKCQRSGKLVAREVDARYHRKGTLSLAMCQEALAVWLECASDLA